MVSLKLCIHWCLVYWWHPWHVQVKSGKGSVTLGLFEVDQSTKKDKVEIKKASFVTTAALSYDACKDNAKSGDETDVDCGGSVCAKKCDEGKACGKDADCGKVGAIAFKCVKSKCTNPKRVPSSFAYKYIPNGGGSQHFDSTYRGYQFVVQNGNGQV